MIQELFGVNNVSILGGERSNLLDTSPSPSPSLSSAPISATATTTTTTPTPSQNLRCPRCDSPNTKFCYYNNYNLTQPRHFCKTCRRYWTKGGALRNVPIGGGCRKNKTVAITSTAGKSSCAPGSLIKAEIGRSPLLNDFDHTELSPNPMLWPSKQNSHLLSLLRVNSNPNPNLNPNLNHNPNPGSPKEEGLMIGSSHFLTSCGLNEWALGLDPFGPLQVPNSIGLGNSYYINQGGLLGEAESNGLQELYQRLRSSTSCYSQHGPIILGHVASGGNNSALLDSAVGGFLNNPTPYWHPTDMPATNGTYP